MRKDWLVDNLYLPLYNRDIKFIKENVVMVKRTMKIIGFAVLGVIVVGAVALDCFCYQNITSLRKVGKGRNRSRCGALPEAC